MILLLDTSTPVCNLVLLGGELRYESNWDAGRSLAKGLLSYVETELQKQNKSFTDITGIGVFKGPGSFTGLRIGLTVVNTLADALGVPIVGEMGEDWQQHAVARLDRRENDQIVLPHYGGEANITLPRK